jgi:hypothetical protein
MIDYSELDKIVVKEIEPNLYQGEYNGRADRIQTNVYGEYAIKILFLDLFNQNEKEIDFLYS